MPKILLISDNHGYVDDKILHHATWADEVWHAGDWLNTDLLLALEGLKKPVRAVWGNADGMELRRIFTEELIFELEGVKVYMIHIGGYPGKYKTGLKGALQRHKPALFICGHSHILRVDRDPLLNNMLCLNPGACGLQGFHKVRTALRFVVADGRVSALEVVEFGQKSA